jgi:hypothetical protein
MGISATSFTKTPQAVDDAWIYYEDQLLAYLPDGTIVPLDVLSNDRGGAAKALYSIDDGLTYNAVTSPSDLCLPTRWSAESQHGKPCRARSTMRR